MFNFETPYPVQEILRCAQNDSMFSIVILSAAKNLRLCEKRSCAVKVTQEKWLHRPKEISFHTVSLGCFQEINFIKDLT